MEDRPTAFGSLPADRSFLCSVLGPEVVDQFAVGVWVIEPDRADQELGVAGAVVPDRACHRRGDPYGAAGGDVDHLVLELELELPGDHVVDLLLGLVAVPVAALAAGARGHQAVGQCDLPGVERLGHEPHRAGIAALEDVGNIADRADRVIAHLYTSSGGPRLICWCLQKICSSCAGSGLGVSGGGSVGALAGTEPSQTSRSSPAGVLSTSTRAVALSTRKVCGTPIGTTATPPGPSWKRSARACTVSRPSSTM